MGLKFFKAKSKDTAYTHKEETVDAVRSRLASKVPEHLLDNAVKGLYPRVNPYPYSEILNHLNTVQFITQQTRMLTMGSCFAQRLAEWLDTNGFNCQNSPWGVVYNPMSIYQIAQYSLDTGNWNPDQLFWETSKGYGDPYRKSDTDAGPMILGDTKEAALATLNDHYQYSRQAFLDADVFVFTYGLTEIFRSSVDNKVFFSMPLKDWYAPDKHEFHNLEYGEIVNCISSTISLIRKHNSNAKFILTVSPVPLSVSFRNHLGPYVSTQFSKSVLHAALYEILHKFEGVFYMPSLEITRIDPINSFQPDGRHVKSETVEIIMAMFKKLYVKEETQENKA